MALIELVLGDITEQDVDVVVACPAIGYRVCRTFGGEQTGMDAAL